MDYQVEHTGYSSIQEVHGYMSLKVPSIDEDIIVDVVERTSSTSGHSVSMYIDIESHQNKSEIIDLFDCEEHFGVYQLTDDDFIQELFSQYGNNA